MDLATGVALSEPGLTHPAKALDQHRGGGERLFPIDQVIEDLVITRWRDGEELSNRALFGPGVLPPLTFELEDPLFQLA